MAKGKIELDRVSFQNLPPENLTQIFGFTDGFLFRQTHTVCMENIADYITFPLCMIFDINDPIMFLITIDLDSI